ncbi:MAG: hypothetical protein H0T89_02755 [Deltaproteobacteria bacterium]|nr:hypothetical protein [Deltaproteobacteria bacterium]MDQ3298542.1 hypothetical protein [Myxococcota bacterium]
MKLAPVVDVRHPMYSSPERREHVIGIAWWMLRTLWMFVIAVPLLAIVIAVMLPRELMHGDGSRSEATERQIKKLKFEAFPLWAVEHLADACPRSLAELATSSDDMTTDAWGTPLEMYCGDDIRGIELRSAGEDGLFRTDDDITSWGGHHGGKAWD